MIVGEETPDEGDVSVPKRMTIGYFRQDVEEMSGRSVLDEAILGSGRVGDLHHELEQLNHAMADPAPADEMDRILARFGEVQEEYEHLGATRSKPRRAKCCTASGSTTSGSTEMSGSCRVGGRCVWGWRGCCSVGRMCS
jgi:ATPase subunit of ABC transporter with duplicated ATPase domains